MGNRRLQKQNRTDRILIAMALAILLLAGGFFYFDNWMWGNRSGRGGQIGRLTSKSGDVRMKFEGDLKWQRAARGQDLIYNDSVYAGAGSQASLVLGDSEMTVTENTLVVLRREDQVNFMNLSYGSLFGKVGAGEKIMIDTGDGKPLELSSNNQARIVVRKIGKKTEVRVTEGEAHITVNGKKNTITKTSRVVLDEKVAKVETIGLEATHPLRDQVVYSEEPSRLDFAWRWNNDRMPASNEDYTLEFSSTPNFAKIHAAKTIKGGLKTSMTVSETLNLYYRVRGPRGEVSQTEKANFVRLHKPFIVKPAVQARFVTPAQQDFPVQIEFKRPAQSSVHYQIATDPEFKEILADEHTRADLQTRDTPVGKYFLRARGEMASGHNTSWTEAVPFSVEQKVEALRLGAAPTQNRVIIPNRTYPAELYSASPAKVKDYLARHGLLRDFFPFAKDSFDRIDMHFDTGARAGQDLSLNTTAWPKEKLRPGTFKYRYQVSKAGFTPTPWSADRRLEIVMEPPTPVGEAQYGNLKKNGERETRWSYTPILYAKSYDLEVSHEPGFMSAREMKVEGTTVTMPLNGGDHYWRVRARDAQGHIISDFSQAYKMAPQPTPVPQYLAKNEDRQPQSTEKTSTRIERVREEPFVKNGWWAWYGAGANYVDYRQSIPGRGTVSDHHPKAPSQYIETGFIGGNGWGAVVSAKQTPGVMNVQDKANGTEFQSGYSWTTVSGEGILRKNSSLRVYDIPVTYGLRVGMQQHKTPFLFLDSDANLHMKTNEMTTASLGVLAEWQRRRWAYYWLMRYQYPFSSKSPGATTFDVSPVFSFDGSVGTSYNLTQQFKVGLFWYGQWHQYNFTYSDGEVTNPGFQSLFYSNVDLRFGFDF